MAYLPNLGAPLGRVATRILDKIPFGASRSGSQQQPTVNLNTLTGGVNQVDWRTRLTVGPAYVTMLHGPILAPLTNSGGIVFPYTPNIFLQHSGNYGGGGLTHSNYDHPSFESHSVGQIAITGAFTANSSADADYIRATIHFLRTVTKMFFGQDESPVPGTPPPVLRLNSHGDYILSNVPVVVEMFSVDLSSNTDYIRTTDGKSRIPTNCQFSVMVKPAYSRASTSRRFSLRGFANGDLLGNRSEGGFL
jgi:hypothetical protein